QHLLYHVFQQYNTTGSATFPKAVNHGQPQKLVQYDTNYLLHLARYKPTYFLDEYSRLLVRNQLLHVSIATIH
ncbi:hypothetical protein BDN71DRAFT_1395241, partial [Pleurotus eryngii]